MTARMEVYQRQKTQDEIGAIVVAFHKMLEKRRQLEAENMGLLSAAQAASRAKSAFLATMSHEIPHANERRDWDDGALTRHRPDGEQREYAETVRKSGEALLEIINDILDFSKVEAGKLDLEIVDFELRTTVEDVLDLFAEQAASKGLELAGLVHTDVPWVAGDPGRLRQILTNLISNAVKFTPPAK